MKKIIYLIIIYVVCAYSVVWADRVEKVKYPKNIKAEEKLEFLYAAQETLRVEFNKRGQEYKEGKITKAEMEAYRKDFLEAKSDVIINDILKLKEEYKASKKFTIDLEDIEK